MRLEFEIPDSAQVAPAVAQAASAMAREVLAAVAQIDGLAVTAVLVPAGAYSGLIAIGDVPVLRGPVHQGWQLAVVPVEDEEADPVDPFERIAELEGQLEAMDTAVISAKSMLDRERTRASEDVAAVQRQLVASQQELTRVKNELGAARAAAAKQVDAPADEMRYAVTLCASCHARDCPGHLAGEAIAMYAAALDKLGDQRAVQELRDQLAIAEAAQAASAKDKGELRKELNATLTELGNARAALDVLRQTREVGRARENVTGSGSCTFCGGTKERSDATFCEADTARLPTAYRSTLAVQRSRAHSQATSGAQAAYEKAVATAKQWLREHPVEIVGASDG